MKSMLDNYLVSLSTNKNFDIKIPSDRSYVPIVSKYFVDFATLNNFNNFDSLLVAFEEALINAIVHGNKEDYSKDVRITFEFSDDSIKISVENEGEGFDYTDAMLKLTQSQENIFQPYGRGIFLISLYTDDFYYENFGKCIVLIKNNEN